MSGPTPYRPRIIDKFIGVPVADKTRPWLDMREDETRARWEKRVSHTCYQCGRFEEDTAALDAHESEHDARSGPGARSEP